MDLLFFAHLLNVLLILAIPITLGFYLTEKLELYWDLWWIGAGTFILSQIGHIPFNFFLSILLNKTSMVLWTPTSQLIFNAVFLGLSAGLWEELFRYGMFRWWARKARSWRTAVLAGAGHGGAEAIAVGIITLISFVNMAVARHADLTASVPPGQLELYTQAVNSYWSMSWSSSLLGALERALTIPIQISLSVLVAQTFIRKQWFWVWLAVLYHALMDGLGAVVAPSFLPAIWVEAVIAIFTLISLVLIFVLRRPEPQVEQRQHFGPPEPVEPKAVDETSENLERTRYQ